MPSSGVTKGPGGKDSMLEATFRIPFYRICEMLFGRQHLLELVHLTPHIKPRQAHIYKSYSTIRDSALMDLRHDILQNTKIFLRHFSAPYGTPLSGL